MEGNIYQEEKFNEDKAKAADITGNLNFNKDKYKKLIEQKEKREKKRVRPPLFKEVVKIKVRP